MLDGGRHTEDHFDIAWEPAVHEALNDSFTEWIHEPQVFRRLADSGVSMILLAAAQDIRPDWPLRQLGALVPRASFRAADAVPHNFWSTHPTEWQRLVTALCREID